MKYYAVLCRPVKFRRQHATYRVYYRYKKKKIIFRGWVCHFCGGRGERSDKSLALSPSHCYYRRNTIGYYDSERDPRTRKDVGKGFVLDSRRINAAASTEPTGNPTTSPTKFFPSVMGSHV